MAKDLTSAELKRVVEGIERLGSYELVTLKAHMLTEIVLGRLLAARLGTAVDSIPPLRFSTLAQLALAGIDEIAGFKDWVKALNDLRNTYAHDVIPREDGTLIRRLVEGIHGTWPTEPSEQLVAFKKSVEIIFVAVLNYAFTTSLTPEQWAEFERGLKERAKRTVDELEKGER